MTWWLLLYALNAPPRPVGFVVWQLSSSQPAVKVYDDGFFTPDPPKVGEVRKDPCTGDCWKLVTGDWLNGAWDGVKCPKHPKIIPSLMRCEEKP